MKSLLIVLVVTFSISLHSQNTVSITIDDVPNTALLKKDGYQSKLLELLDEYEIPIAIFINEGLIYKTDATAKNTKVLENWAAKDFITLGNHTFSHARYSTVGIDSFSKEILKGEVLSNELASKYNKPLKYFRFPYNDLGADALQHARIKAFLESRNYISTPFTIESSDWMYNFVYEQYLNKGESEKAKRIGEDYVSKTMECFDFFEAMAQEEYGRAVHQIYLCHDNQLNADYLETLILKLTERKNQFISLETALSDPIYSQPDHYYEQWGISWLYRWKATQKERNEKMNQEPEMTEIEKLYHEMVNPN